MNIKVRQTPHVIGTPGLEDDIRKQMQVYCVFIAGGCGLKAPMKREKSLGAFCSQLSHPHLIITELLRRPGGFLSRQRLVIYAAGEIALGYSAS